LQYVALASRDWNTAARRMWRVNYCYNNQLRYSICMWSSSSNPQQ